jgi:hypothetical protein
MGSGVSGLVDKGKIIQFPGSEDVKNITNKSTKGMTDKELMDEGKKTLNFMRLVNTRLKNFQEIIKRSERGVIYPQDQLEQVKIQEEALTVAMDYLQSKYDIINNEYSRRRKNRGE